MMEKNKNLYYWEGIKRSGEKIHGLIETSSSAMVKTELGKQGIIWKKIWKKRMTVFTKITPIDIIHFCRQIALMLKAGIPLIQAFDIVAYSQTNLLMKYLIAEIKKAVETGLTFSEALNKHPQLFSDLICNLVAAGEKSGKLEIMLDMVANYKEKIATIKKKIIKALTYPLVVLLIACLVSLGLLTFVVPQFAALFNSFGAELPALTRMIIYLSDLLKIYWLIIFLFFSGLSYSYVIARKHWRWFREAIDKIQLKLPLLGPVVVKAIIVRFAQTLAITFAAGLPLVDALKTVAGVTGNKVYVKASADIIENVSTGQQLHFALKNTQLFPNMVIQMIAIGEESGTLEFMLIKVANFYEEEINNAVDTLNNLLEPIIMTLLGVLVGGLVIAMYLPIFKLGSVG
jgi:type IV pilus assembly protein PilC